MEREPLQPLPKRAPAETPQPQTEQEHGGFFEKWRKKVKRTAEQEPQNKTPESAEKAPAPEAPKPERRAFGKKILGLIFGSEVQKPEETERLVTPEATQPQYERATRMRRFARVIIANVLGEAAQEPARARRMQESEPLDTAPLVEAAHELRDAIDDLNETVIESRESASAPAAVEASRGEGGYDSFESRFTRSGISLEQTASERIDDRLRQLEESVEVSRGAAVAAAGLGVLAVILTGAEYFSRKRTEHDIKHETKEVKAAFKKQERVMEQQQVVFDRLRETQTQGMDRNQRQEYYERLGAFTHQQAERTREATIELEQAVERSNPPESYSVERTRREEPAQERRERRPRQLEVAQVPEQPEIAPLVRVEKADTIETAPGRQTGNAGMGFFGGGGSIPGDAGTSDLNGLRRPIDPNSPEARKLEELRKIEQARLQQNAWFYGAALIVAMGALLIVTIVVG